jgi:Ca2+-binding RTX toxin-like protein
LQTSYDALVAPKSLAATASATPDNLIGGTGNDVFSAAAGTVAATDRFTDTSTTDNDTFTIVHSTTLGAFTSTNIETIDVTLNALGALPIDMANITGATSFTVSRGDVVVGGATLAGDKGVSVTNVDASQIGSITVGAGTTTVNVDSAATDAAGHVLNLDNATGAITVDGAATINAALSSQVDIDAVSNTAAAQTGKATVINAASATIVTTDAALTGAVTINAAKGTTVTINDAQGGATVNAATAHTADSTVTVTDADSSGATITVGTGFDDSVTTTNISVDVVVRGTAASTDTATVSGAGYIGLDIDGTASQQNVDAVTLSGNGAGVVYNLLAPASGTATSFTKAGTQSVEIMGDTSEFSGVTITGIDVIDANAGGGADFNGGLFSGVGKVDLGVAVGNNSITAVSGSTYEITADQTTKTDFGFSAAGGGDLTIIAGDDNGASASVGTILLANFDAAAAATTVGNVTIEASIANVDATGVTLGAKQNLIITGDEDVNLADRATAETVTADSIDASGSSGIITLNVEDAAGAATVDTITTGSGNDLMTLDGTGVLTVSSGAGNDTITITDADATSTFDAGAGNDTIDVDEVGQVVVIGGAGTDNFTTAVAIGGTIIGGDGTDTITIDAAIGGGNLTFAATFAFSGIEELDITAGDDKISMTGAQLAGNSTLILDGSANDTFNVNTGSTASLNKSADLSGLTKTTAGAALVTVTGGAGVDTITGGVLSEGFTMTAKADTIEGGGGTGVDTLTGVASLASNSGVIINMGATAVSSASVNSNASVFIAGNLAEIGAGKAGYLFTTNSTANSVDVDTVGGIENLVGTAGVDYLVGNTENNNLSGAAEADFIDGGAGADTLTGGAGADTIELGAADAVVDTVVFEATLNGLDTIKEFVFGAAGDKLNFDAILGTGAAHYNVANAGLAVADDAVAITGTSNIALANVDDKVAFISTANIATASVTEANFFATSKVFAAEGTIAFNIVLAVGEVSGTDGVKLYQVVDGTNANDLTITQIGNIEGTSLAAIDAANIF